MKIDPDVTRAAKLASALSLRTVGFDVLEARRLGPPGAHGPLEWELETIDASWQRADREVSVVIPFVVHVRSAAKTARYECRVVVRSTYEAAAGSPPPDGDVDHFAGVFAVLHAWPYARAELQALSAKVGLDAILLPSLVAEQIADAVTVSRAAPSRARAKKK